MSIFRRKRRGYNSGADLIGDTEDGFILPLSSVESYPPYYASTCSASAVYPMSEEGIFQLGSGSSQVVPYLTWAHNANKPKRFINSYKCPWCGQWTEKLYCEYCGGPQQ